MGGIHHRNPEPFGKVPDYPENQLRGDTAAYHNVLGPGKRVRVNPGDRLKPFSSIDKIMDWYYRHGYTPRNWG